MTINRAICNQCRGVVKDDNFPEELVWMCVNIDKDRKKLIQLDDKSNPPEGCPRFFEHAVAGGSDNA